jgi:hypothetical protein
MKRSLALAVKVRAGSASARSSKEVEHVRAERTKAGARRNEMSKRREPEGGPS